MKQLVFLISLFSMLAAGATSMSLDEFKLRQAQSHNEISDADVIKAAKSDSIARAAFLQAKGCKVKVTQKPKVQSDMFQINLECTDEGNEFTGGGVYLNIYIEGQYFGKGSVDVQKIEIHRAG